MDSSTPTPPGLELREDRSHQQVNREITSQHGSCPSTISPPLSIVNVQNDHRLDIDHALPNSPSVQDEQILRNDHLLHGDNSFVDDDTASDVDPSHEDRLHAYNELYLSLYKELIDLQKLRSLHYENVERIHHVVRTFYRATEPPASPELELLLSSAKASLDEAKKGLVRLMNEAKKLHDMGESPSLVVMRAMKD